MSNTDTRPQEIMQAAMHGHSAHSPAQSTANIDWQALHRLIPWFAALTAWVMWAMFLLIPTAFGLHYAGMFPAASNWLYVGMGLTLCLAATVAAQVQHGARAILFTFATLLLSYWF
ncbi:MAG: hypothetical protein R3E93_08720 [Thiothrix sp.]